MMGHESKVLHEMNKRTECSVSTNDTGLCYKSKCREKCMLQGAANTDRRPVLDVNIIATSAFAAF